MESQTVAVVGGSYDPPGIHHLMVISELLNLKQVDRVMIVPCGERTDKKLKTSSEQRLQMIRLAVEEFLNNDSRVTVEDIEIKNGPSIPSYFLMKKLKEKPEYQGLQFKFVIGSDLVPWLPSWDEGPKFMEENDFIVFTRGGQAINKDQLPKSSTVVQETFVTDMSSTFLRARIKQVRAENPLDTTLGVLGLIPKKTREYILTENLYF